MNIFVTSPCPYKSAIVLPDRHVTKMAVETCQMLALIASPWYHEYGTLPKANGEPYKTSQGAHRNHPCTVWASQSIHNAQWLINHGIDLCEEFHKRYSKKHACYDTLQIALNIFPKGDKTKTTDFVRAMPDEYKLNTSIDTFTAYKKYINSKDWVKNNYLKIPERRPEWVHI